MRRAERVEQLEEEERWGEGDSVFGLPKVAHRKSHAGRKSTEDAAEEKEVAAEGTVAAETPKGEEKAG